MAEACDAVNVSRATYYRLTKVTVVRRAQRKPSRSNRALSQAEASEVLRILESPEYIDMSPREIFASLADKGEYHCSISTMYRLMRKNYAVKERRACRKHQKHEMPVLKATRPNQVWAWDITKIKGPQAWHFYYLYTIVDLYSRKVVGWMVAEKENGELAKRLFSTTCKRERVDASKLIIHSDRGSAMTSLTLGLLFASLGIVKSLSRPRVSNDNAFVESLFKTLKYRQLYPNRFDSLEEVTQYMREFFRWYNFKHYHSGIALLTPHTLHAGKENAVLKRRQMALDEAYLRHPERYVLGPPKVQTPPSTVWINKPEDEAGEKAA